jgi:tetratricopeptide (TPR) repeat protein
MGSTQSPGRFITQIRCADAYNNRGNAWRDKKDYTRAIADYDFAIKLNPSYANAFYNRGSARLDSGDKDGAVTDYRQALKLSPGLSQAANMLKQLGAKP